MHGEQASIGWVASFLPWKLIALILRSGLACASLLVSRAWVGLGSYFGGSVFALFLLFARREEVPSRAFLLYRSGKPRLTGSMGM